MWDVECGEGVEWDVECGEGVEWDMECGEGVECGLLWSWSYGVV